jgi:glycerophosphoryl diester phosphodiesterase
MNGGGEVGVAETEALESDDPTIMLRKWIVGSDPCKYAGDCRFILCLKYGENEYNTKQASLPVYKGIEPDETIVTQYHTALTELVERIQYLAGKYAWTGTTWEGLVNYDTVSNMSKQNAADAKRYAAEAQQSATNAQTLATRIEDYIEDLENEEDKINKIYDALDFSVSPNICPTATITTAANEPVVTSTMGHVESDQVYCFSVNVGTIPGSGWGLFLVPDDHSAIIDPVTGISSSQTGRAYGVFRPVKSGTLYCKQPVTGTDGTIVFSNCQIEKGWLPTAYVPYGSINVVDSTARNSVAEAQDEIDKLNWDSNILSVAHHGYTYGNLAQPNTLQAFKFAKKRGFDWFSTSIQPTLDGVLIITEDGIVDTESETGVDCWTVNYEDIVPAPLKFDEVVKTAAMYGLGILVRMYGSHFTSNNYAYVTNVLNTHRIPHAFLGNTVNNLRSLRLKDYECEVILHINSKPSVEDLANSSDYTKLRDLVQQAPGVSIMFPMAQGTSAEDRVIVVDQDYMTQVNALGIGLISVPNNDGIIDDVINFSNMWISSSICAKEYIKQHFPIS